MLGIAGLKAELADPLLYGFCDGGTGWWLWRLEGLVEVLLLVGAGEDEEDLERPPVAREFLLISEGNTNGGGMVGTGVTEEAIKGLAPVLGLTLLTGFLVGLGTSLLKDEMLDMLE